MCEEMLNGGRLKNNEYVFIWNKCGFKKVAFNNICFLEAARSYCEIHFNDGKTFLISMSMSETFVFFPKEEFIRVHRSYIINLKYVEELIGNEFTLNTGVKIPVGREYRQTVYQCLLFIGTKNHKYGK